MIANLWSMALTDHCNWYWELPHSWGWAKECRQTFLHASFISIDRLKDLDILEELDRMLEEKRREVSIFDGPTCAYHRKIVDNLLLFSRHFCQLQEHKNWQLPSDIIVCVNLKENEVMVCLFFYQASWRMLATWQPFLCQCKPHTCFGNVLSKNWMHITFLNFKSIFGMERTDRYLFHLWNHVYWPYMDTWKCLWVKHKHKFRK